MKLPLLNLNFESAEDYVQKRVQLLKQFAEVKTSLESSLRAHGFHSGMLSSLSTNYNAYEMLKELLEGNPDYRTQSHSSKLVLQLDKAGRNYGLHLETESSINDGKELSFIEDLYLVLPDDDKKAWLHLPKDFNEKIGKRLEEVPIPDEFPYGLPEGTLFLSKDGFEPVANVFKVARANNKTIYLTAKMGKANLSYEGGTTHPWRIHADFSDKDLRELSNIAELVDVFYS